VVARFLKRDPGIVHDAATLRRLLTMLRDMGIIAVQAPPSKSTREKFLDAYRRYILQERGLAESTAQGYLAYAEHFLSYRFGAGDLKIHELRAPDVTKFVQDRAPLEKERARLLVTGIRCFLRYLWYRGETNCDLAVCVPAVAVWSLSTLPKFLPAGAVPRVLTRCEQKSPDGKRNYAVLLLLARLGLRACEIVALNLSDIDWKNGRITVRGKGGRRTQLPLPIDVGEALALYIRYGRPCCKCARVFVRHRAPIRGFANSGALCSIVRRALIRAGIDTARKGAHLFRHTLATDLLRQGSSLEDIGKVLRHQSPNTTALYAKVDLTRLRTLALPWPGGAQ
jgi:integrase